VSATTLMCWRPWRPASVRELSCHSANLRGVPVVDRGRVSSNNITAPCVVNRPATCNWTSSSTATPHVLGHPRWRACRFHCPCSAATSGHRGHRPERLGRCPGLPVRRTDAGGLHHFFLLSAPSGIATPRRVARFGSVTVQPMLDCSRLAAATSPSAIVTGLAPSSSERSRDLYSVPADSFVGTLIHYEFTPR